MFSVFIESAGKKYYRQWIFRNVTLSFSSPERIVILGANGSGKSTLLQLLSGAITPNKGRLLYKYGQNEIPEENIYQYISIAAPYLELIEEFTMNEIIDFHFKFKKTIGSLSKKDLIELSGLSGKEDRQFRYFSSGMKQRVRLLLAICSDTSLLLLDEPCSNLDQQAIDWYNGLVNRFAGDRLIVVASNHQKNEYGFCNREINIGDYKYEKVG